MQARGRARLHELWELFADQFPATPWLSGDRLGALDILAATVSMWSGARKALAQSRPAFSALLAPDRGRSARRRGLGEALAEALSRGSRPVRAPSFACCVSSSHARGRRACGRPRRCRRRAGRPDQRLSPRAAALRRPAPAGGPPLAPSALLAGIAPAEPNDFGAALRASGYPAAAATSLRLVGPADPGAAFRFVAERHCAVLLDPRYSQIGVARSAGNTWRINLAKPLLPRRPRRLAASRPADPASWSTRRGPGRGSAAASASPRPGRWPGTRRSAWPR